MNEFGDAQDSLDAHGMDLVKVLRFAQSTGEQTSRVSVVGCEPEGFGGEEGLLGLSAALQAAIECGG